MPATRLSEEEEGDPPEKPVAPSTAVRVPGFKWIVALLAASLGCNAVILIAVAVHAIGTSSPDALPTTVKGDDGCGAHGIALVDRPGACECHQCSLGPRCEARQAECVLDAGSGNPLLFEDYWRRQPNLTVGIPMAYRMGYVMGDQATNGLQLAALTDAIRDVHRLVGNVAAGALTGHTLVLGVGSTQLLNAAVWAHAHTRAPRVFTSQVPYYSGYPSIVQYYASNLVSWSDTPSVGDDVVEFVTSPNNPDGALRRPSYRGAAAVHDLAYYWPHFTPVPEALDHDVMLFTLSKLTGHAGTRVGWAFVRDPALAQRMAQYVVGATLGIPHEAQLRAWVALRHYVATNGAPLTAMAQEMRRRWARLQAVQGSGTVGFTLQPLAAPDRCLFRKAVVAPTPAYAWLRCDGPDDTVDCYERLRNASSVLGRPGPAYGAAPRYVRLSLLMRADEFDTLADRVPLLGPA